MVFSSETFLFFFLPLFLCAYVATPTRFRAGTLLIGSYLFYAWWRVDFLLLLLGVTIWSHSIGRGILRATTQGQRTRLLWIGVSGCLGVLAYFKYAHFFLETIADVFGTSADDLAIHWKIVLPIGISFYIFQAISFLVDAYRGDVEQEPNLIDYAAFLSLFPQLIAGPILRYKDLAHQFADLSIHWNMFSEGIYRFVLGLAMKVIIADNLAPLADTAFAEANPTLWLAWGGAVAYALQLFFDFAGYSAMAIGLGLMMGFRFIENFDEPYISRSITEFWRRWHISLSTYLRDYLYIPLGGNRKGPVRTYANLMIVMGLGGLWHGAAMTFVIWGMWHGMCLAIERLTGQDKRAVTVWWSWPVTMLLVLVGWVMFRASTPLEAFGLYAGMLGLNGIATPAHILLVLSKQSVLTGALAIAVIGARPLWRWVSPRLGHAAPQTRRGKSAATTVADLSTPLIVISLFVLSILLLAEASNSPFLYFQF